MAELIVLRDLPGVQRISELSRSPRSYEYPKASYTFAEMREVSNSLFCITDYDTWLDDDDPRDLEEYERMFHVCDLPYSEGKLFFDAAGWDTSDGNGEEMPGAHHFLRQIVALVRGCVEGVRFCPDGGGEAAYDWDGELVEGGEHFENWIKAEADRFLTSKGLPPTE